MRTSRTSAMDDGREFRIRSTRAKAQTAAKKAGGGVSRSGRITSGNRSRFGHGKLTSIQANRFIGVIPGKPAQAREL